MKTYTISHPKHFFLCLFYSVLTCTQQVLDVKPHIFFSVYPLFTLYYGFITIPRLHHIYEYNTVEHTVPKWTYLLRAYFHTVLLDTIPFAGIVSVFLIIVIMMWKEIRFLIVHAENRLKKIDEKI